MSPVALGRGRPRLWRHDYLHLRPLARDLERAVGGADLPGGSLVVLDIGSGASPYRTLFGEKARRFVRVDLDAASLPSVVARAETLPFPDGVFDAVLSTQLLGLVDDPGATAREIVRVTRPGGRVWVSTPAAWPYDSARVEHRFGAPQLPGLFPGVAIDGVLPEGGLLALPFALLNLAVREAARSAERRLGAPARILRGPAVGLYLVSNLAGRALEHLAAAGPLAPFLGYLDARLPMNYLVCGRRES